jgi:Holliday junction DNA helicase RuvA
MIYTLRGKTTIIGDNFFVLECAGVGYKVFTNKRTLASLPIEEFLVYCYHHIREDQEDLFGFLETESLRLFELLNTVSGVGPKTALGILDLESVPNILAAILEKRADVLSHASGIGKKTAERIILELQAKIALVGSEALMKSADENLEVEEVLISLGYPRAKAREAVRGLPKDLKNMEERLRKALQDLGR